MKVADKRCIHLDFHTSEEIDGIGKYFDKEEFKQNLKKTKVDSITLFAKCHHGCFYYKSDKFFTHPHLETNLLDQQVEACKELGVSFKIYISAGIDEHLAIQHPDWLFLDSNGIYPNPLQPGFKLLCYNSDYLDVLKAQTIEVMERYNPDGIFYDIIVNSPCYCHKCLAEMKSLGFNYNNLTDAKNFAKMTLNRFTKTMIELIKSYNKDALVFFNSGNFNPGFRDFINSCDQLEIESLPTGQWGYDHFPVSVAYLRRLGKNCIGMTGKFHGTWGEFGTFKYKNALKYEAAQCIAYNTGMNVGDQLHPNGKMDNYTYENISEAMTFHKDRESLLGGEYVPELAILSECLIGGSIDKKHDSGIARMLLEDKYLFDIIDIYEDFNKYPLIIMPDVLTVEKELALKLKDYCKNGGKILASGLSATLNNEFVVDLGAKFLEKSKDYLTYFKPNYTMDFCNDTALVQYGNNYEIECTGTILAKKFPPYFNREGTHFCSHSNVPCNYEITKVGITQGKDGIYISSEIFEDYVENGTMNCKQIVLPLIKKLLTKKIIHTNLPSSGKVTLYKKENDFIFNMLYANIVTRGKSVQIIEDIPTLSDIYVNLDLGVKVKEIIEMPENKKIEFKQDNGKITIDIKKFNLLKSFVLKI